MLKNFLILLFALIIGLLIALYAKKITPVEKKETKIRHEERTFNEEVIGFDLLDPEMAPKEIKEKVMYGYKILLHTNKILPKYVDDRLTCANCHFGAGNTLGGKRGGISLVGVVKTYPRYSERMGKSIDLVERINNCFERSMNGKALPSGSQEMKAILAYLDWISSGIPDRKNYPWLGLELLVSEHIPNPENGAEVYLKNCSMCHMKNGQGTVHNPPLWGPHAFNDGAGMSMLPKMASFIFYNMPLDDPFLTKEQALDVASYLINQRRPTFIPQQ